MKTLTPKYYNKFKCIASKCTHNCCIGWEIDIDKSTLEYYNSLDGDMGKRLAQNIDTTDCAHFILTSEERCPFLNNEGLCDIITELGEERLCQICADHPRFRNFYSSFIEMGLGLCCEEAARIILSETDKFSIEIASTDDCQEQFFFKFRSTILDILQDRDFSFDERVENLFDFLGTGMPDLNMQYWGNILSSLEIMDDDWRTLISDMGDDISPKQNDMIYEQLACYFIFRHLTGALDDGEYIARVKMCVLFCNIIASVTNKTGRDIAEICRLFSAEIEYSDQNIQKILDILI